VPGPVTDPRAHALRDRYHRRFAVSALPVPVESIAQDLLGLDVEEASGMTVSGYLLPAERRVVVNADEPPARRRFTLAHELGHWVCQVLEGRVAPVYCRSSDVAMDVISRSWGGAGQGGEPEGRRTVHASTADARGRGILPPAASGVGAGGLRPPVAVAAQEREANVFAAELLMPEPAVRATFAGSIPACAAAFGVSEEAMHWRLYNLALIEERPAP
jgi:hypothetical protein